MSEIIPEKAASIVIGKAVDAVVLTEPGQIAAEELGKAALTIVRTVNTVLLPLVAVNAMGEKARRYFNDRFHHDMEHSLRKIPEANRIEPKASIAAPALLGLSYSYGEAELRTMYLNLIATAMDGRVSTLSHPAFVETVKQMNGLEARLFAERARHNFAPLVASANFKGIVDGKIRSNTYDDMLDWRHRATGTPVVVEGLALSVGAWRRLGLVRTRIGPPQVPPTPAERAMLRSAPVQRLIDAMPGRVVTIATGTLGMTFFGRRFALAVGASEIRPELDDPMIVPYRTTLELAE